MRSRVLLTNGPRTVDLFWLRHTGTDVYCGLTGSARHRTYHQSGKLHTRTDGQKENEAWVAPLAHINGQFHLTTVSLQDPMRFLEAARGDLEFSGKKSDAAVFIDARTVPREAQLNVGIGLMEPHNFKVVASLAEEMVLPEGDRILPAQVLLCTSVQPWVYVLTTWWQAPPNSNSQPPPASRPDAAAN